MAKVIAKLFKRPDDISQAVADLKAKGYSTTIIDSSASIDRELADAGLSEQALDYYKIGIATGGKIVKVSVDDARANEASKLLLETGIDQLADKSSERVASPGFKKARKMSATNPIDAQMTGDFRKY